MDGMLEKYSGKNWWKYILVAPSLFILITAFYYFLPYILENTPNLTTFNSNGGRLEATSIFASTLLTLALFIVYWSMSNTQQRQVEIMENQTEIMENQNKLIETEDQPLIDIDSVIPGSMTSFGWSKGGIQLGLVNVGNGIAFLPRLATELEFESEEYSSNKSIAFLRPVNAENGTLFSGLQATIPADSKIYQFRTSPSAELQHGDKKESENIPEQLDTLFNSDVENVTITISIEITSFIEKEQTFRVLELEVSKERFESYSQSGERITLSDIIPMSVEESLPTLLEEMGYTHHYRDMEDFSDKTAMILVRATEMGVEELAEEYDIDLPDSVVSFDEEKESDRSSDASSS